MSDTTTVEIPTHIGHIARTLLPWQTADEGRTECGHQCSAMKSIVTLDEAKAILRKAGARDRASLFLCITCMETANRHGHNFVAAFQRHFDDYRWVRDPLVKARLIVEAEALERLVTENAETIRGYIAGHAETVDISELRRKKTAKPRVARGRGL